MKNLRNENYVDRIIRFYVAIAAAVVVRYTHGGARYFWLVVAIIALISSLSGFSLFYKLVGISTLKK